MQCAWQVYLLGLLEATPILILSTALATRGCYEGAMCSRFGIQPPRPEKTPCQCHFSRRSFCTPLVCFPESNQVGNNPQPICGASGHRRRSEEHTSELQSLR